MYTLIVSGLCFMAYTIGNLNETVPIFNKVENLSKANCNKLIDTYSDFYTKRQHSCQLIISCVETEK